MTAATTSTATSAGTGAINTGALPIVPDFQLQALRTIAGQGAADMSQAYQPYTGPTVAALTPDQLNAQQMARDVASGTTANPAQLQSAINYGVSGFDPNEVNKYMSPYTSGVVNEIGRLGNQNLMQNVIPGVNSTFTGSGQFGSTRNGNFLNNAIQDNTYNTLGQQSNALQAAETAGLNAYTNWHNQAIPNAANAATMETTSANNLNAAGTQEQQQTQKNYTQAQTDFQNQVAYPQQQLGWYSNLMSGQNMPSGSVGTSMATSTPPSALQQGIGTALNIYGTYNTANK